MSKVLRRVSRIFLGAILGLYVYGCGDNSDTGGGGSGDSGNSLDPDVVCSVCVDDGFAFQCPRILEECLEEDILDADECVDNAQISCNQL